VRRVGLALALAVLVAVRAAAGEVAPDAGAAADGALAPCADPPADGPVSIDDASLPGASISTDDPPAPPEAEGTQSLKDLGQMALTDTVTILGAPLHWTAQNWLVFGGVAAGVVAVGYAFDYPMRNKTQAHQTAALDDMTRIVEPFGESYSFAVLGIYGIAGYVFHAPDARETFVDGIMASILASGIITPTLKFVIGRDRPSQSTSSTSFHPFQGSDNSMPSGHATQAFAVASVISAHSDEVWVSVTAYTIAGLVGFARIYHNAHWTSDVTAGAAIGTFVGRGIVALNDRLRKGDGKVHIAFAPLISDQAKGGTLVMDW
jgi:membrane-associated phospholipid phosphatase